MSHYRAGREVEYAVIHDLRDNGYDTIRAASSKGIADIAAFKPGQCVLVNVKKKDGPPPWERSELLRVAGYVDAVPLVALGPASKVTYRRLTGLGPKDWTKWTPDEVAR